MPELVIGNYIRFERSNGDITTAYVCFISTEFVGVSWIEDGKKFGKLVLKSEIIDSNKKLRLRPLELLIIFLSIIFFSSLVVFFFWSSTHI